MGVVVVAVPHALRVTMMMMVGSPLLHIVVGDVVGDNLAIPPLPCLRRMLMR